VKSWKRRGNDVLRTWGAVVLCPTKLYAPWITRDEDRLRSFVANGAPQDDNSSFSGWRQRIVTSF